MKELIEQVRHIISWIAKDTKLVDSDIAVLRNVITALEAAEAEIESAKISYAGAEACIGMLTKQNEELREQEQISTLAYELADSILERICIQLKGPHPDKGRHSHHDLPEVMAAQIAELRARVAELEGMVPALDLEAALRKHAIPAAECPGISKVVVLSSALRIIQSLLPAAPKEEV